MGLRLLRDSPRRSENKSIIMRVQRLTGPMFQDDI